MKKQETEADNKLSPRQKIFVNILFLWILISVFDYRIAGEKAMIDFLKYIYYLIPCIVLLIYGFLDNILLWWALVCSSAIFTVYNIVELLNGFKQEWLNIITLIGICGLMVAITILLVKVKPQKKVS